MLREGRYSCAHNCLWSHVHIYMSQNHAICICELHRMNIVWHWVGNIRAVSDSFFTGIWHILTSACSYSLDMIQLFIWWLHNIELSKHISEFVFHVFCQRCGEYITSLTEKNILITILTNSSSLKKNWSKCHLVLFLIAVTRIRAIEQWHPCYTIKSVWNLSVLSSSALFALENTWTWCKHE